MKFSVCWAIIGAGKTTTINVLSAGELPPYPSARKTAVVYGKDIGNPEAILLTGAGRLPAARRALPHLTLREHVAFLANSKVATPRLAAKDATTP